MFQLTLPGDHRDQSEWHPEWPTCWAPSPGGPRSVPGTPAANRAVQGRTWYERQKVCPASNI